MSTKGLSNTAARLLVDDMCGRYSIPLLVLHDFDKAGFSIVGTLKQSNRRYNFRNNVEVIDLGLRLDDVEDLEAEDAYDRGSEEKITANLRTTVRRRRRSSSCSHNASSSTPSPPTSLSTSSKRSSKSTASKRSCRTRSGWHRYLEFALGSRARSEATGATNFALTCGKPRAGGLRRDQTLLFMKAADRHRALLRCT
jgi:hypothetical protein